MGKVVPRLAKLAIAVPKFSILSFSDFIISIAASRLALASSSALFSAFIIAVSTLGANDTICPRVLAAVIFFSKALLSAPDKPEDLMSPINSSCKLLIKVLRASAASF